jgi:DNA helicase-2/ATP-dependent DNA helicase PcrA
MPSGARAIRNIVEFEQDYPDARTILLEQNYRSTQTILRRPMPSSPATPGRRPKNLWTDSGEGRASSATSPTTSTTRPSFVARTDRRLTDEHGVKPKDVAVFYRTNAQSRAMEEVFVRVGLPYKVVGGTRFYERARSRTRSPTCG